MSSDFVDLLKLLEKWRVEYVVIGGYAVMEYTEPRATKDIDLLVACNKRNSRKIYAALKEFGAALTGVSEGFFAEKENFYKIGRPPNRIDIITSAAGEKFPIIWKNRIKRDVFGVSVNMISKKDLIKLKAAAGRPQDLADLDKLKKFKATRSK